MADIFQAAAEADRSGKGFDLFCQITDLIEGPAQPHFGQEKVFDENSSHDQVESPLAEAIEILAGKNILVAALPLVGHIPGQVEMGIDDKAVCIQLGGLAGEFLVHVLVLPVGWKKILKINNLKW